MSTTENLYEMCEPIAVLRKRFLSFTDNNYCAAFILDQFVAEIATREEDAWYEAKYHKTPLSYVIERSIQEITNRLFGLFTYEQVVEALNLLIKKQYIGNNGRVEGTEDRYRFPINRTKINYDTDVYQGRKPAQEQDVLAYAPMDAPDTEESQPSQMQPPTSDEEYTVYALIDPRDDAIHYIGISKNVSRRYKQHCNCQGVNLELNLWVQELLRQDLAPVLRVIETVTGTRSAQDRETHWIQHYFCSPLKNIAKAERDGGTRVDNPLIDEMVKRMIREEMSHE